MNYNQMHTELRKLNTILYETFEKQLKDIDSVASICYHGQYNKFTISIFHTNNTIIKLNSIEIETEHIILISDYQRTPEIEQLAQDLTKFIMNEIRSS